MTTEVWSVPFQFDFQTAHRILAGEFLAPRGEAVPPPTDRGRAGRRGLGRDAKRRPDPRTPAPRGTEACRSPMNRKSAGRPASRARRLRLAPRGPRWAYPFRRQRRLPTAAGPGSAAGGRYRRSERLCHRGPSGARLARRDRAAWTSGERCALGTAGRPPHPLPHHEALSRRPPSGQGDRNIIFE